MGLIRAILEKWACKHQWQPRLSIDLYPGRREESAPNGIVVWYCCKSCGKFKRIRE